MKNWVEKNWLLVPVILIGVVAVAIFEATLLYRTDPVPTLQVQQIANITLTGSANRFDYTYLDPHTRLLYLAHSASNTVIIFDTVSRKIVANIPGIADVHSVAVASDLGRIFATQAVGNNPDLMALDSGWHYLYVASESGVVSVFDEHGRTIKKLNEGFVDPGGAHTIAVDQETHYIYLPLENVGGIPILRIALFHQSAS